MAAVLPGGDELISEHVRVSARVKCVFYIYRNSMRDFNES